MSPHLAALQRRAPDLVIALLVFASMRQGAFYTPDSVVLPAALVAAAVLCCIGRLHRGSPAPAVAVLAVLFVAWWYYRTSASGSWAFAHQMAAGVVAFAACYAVGTALPERDRERVQASLVTVGALAAGVGLLGLALRLQPLTLLAQDHFRLAGTLTYSNATGALLALLLMPALALPAHRRTLRCTSVYLVVAGLLATQSRGAVLAAGLGLLLLCRRRWWSPAWRCSSAAASGPWPS